MYLHWTLNNHLSIVYAISFSLTSLNQICPVDGIDMIDGNLMEVYTVSIQMAILRKTLFHFLSITFIIH